MFKLFSQSRSQKTLSKRRLQTRRRLSAEVLESRQLLAGMTFDSLQSFGDGVGATSVVSLAVDAHGNSYMTGNFEGTVDFDPGQTHLDNADILTSVGTGRDLYVAKYDAQDTLLWAKRFGSDTTTVNKEETVYAIKLDQANNVYLTGRFRDSLQIDSFTLVSAGEDDGFLVKLDDNGSTAWTTRWGSVTHNENGLQLAVGSTGELYVGASKTLPSGSTSTEPRETQLRRIDPATGDLLWNKSWGNDTNSNLDLKVDSTGNIVLARLFGNAFDADPGPGETMLMHATATNAYFSTSVIQLDSSGDFRWARAFDLFANPSPNGVSAALFGRMAIDLNDNIVMTGTHFGRVDYDPSANGSAELSLTASAFIVKLNNAGEFVWVRGVEGSASYEFRGEISIDSANNIITSAIVQGRTATLDFDPGPGTAFVTPLNNNASIRDGILWSLTEAGEFRAVTHLGTAGASTEPRGLVIDASNRWHVIGSFKGTVDFDPGVGVSQVSSAALSGFSLRLNPKPGITVSQTKRLVTTEAGGTARFSVSLDAAPTANVTIPVSSSNLTEGTVSVSSLTFTPVNWNVRQNVIIQGIDDTTFDRDVTYTVILGAAISADPRYSGLAVADVSAINIDNDVPVTKFFVVDDGATDRTYEYGANGTAIENYVLRSSNSAPRGAASTVAGNQVWVVDSVGVVYVYNDGGLLLGSWFAGTMSWSSVSEGIATNGSDVWIVDNFSDRVFRYSGAATRLSGEQNAVSSFKLNSANKNPKDIVTDGTHLWVVDDSTTDRVFKYTLAGSLVGSWTIGSANSKPTGLTIDPSGASQSIWIVDNGTDRVYEYTNSRGRNSGGQTASVTFSLAAGNTNPQGIAVSPANLINATTMVAATSGTSIGSLSYQVSPGAEFPQDHVAFASRSISVGLVADDNALTTGKLRNSQPATLILEKGSMMTTLVTPTPQLSTSKSSSVAARDEAFSSVDLLEDENLLDLLTTSVKGSLNRRRM